MALGRDRFKEILEQITQKAATDANFRARCLENPQGVLRDEFGEDLPDFGKIRFVDSDETILRLPPYGHDSSLEPPDLTEEMMSIDIASTVVPNM